MLEAIISDVHFPDHSIAAWELTLKLLSKIKPDAITLLGDLLDEDCVGRWPTKPEHLTTLQWEFDVTNRELGRLVDLNPQAKFRFQPGNHDIRVEHFLQSKAPELASLRSLSLESLMGLEELGIEFIAEDQKWRIGELYHSHGHLFKAGSVAVARNLYKQLGVNMIVGHWHRHQSHTETRYNGRSYLVAVNGTLQNFSVKYAHHHSWTAGITLIDYTPSGHFKYMPVQYFHEDGYVRYVNNGELFQELLCGSEKYPEQKKELVINIGGKNVKAPKAATSRSNQNRKQRGSSSNSNEPCTSGLFAV